MTKASWVQTVMVATATVAIVTLMAVFALAPAASADNFSPAKPVAATSSDQRAGIAGKTLNDLLHGVHGRQAPSASTVDPVIGDLIYNGVGIVLAVGAGLACVVANIPAGLAMTAKIDPAAAGLVLTYCGDFLPPDATQVAKNAAGLGSAVANLVGNPLGGLLFPGLPTM